MLSKNLRGTVAAISAVAMMMGTLSMPVMNISAESIMIGKTSSDVETLRWNTLETSPAKQSLAVEDGTLHVKVEKAKGGDGENWDLRLVHENLDFKAGHVYEVSFKAKAKRKGMELVSSIGTPEGDIEYFVLLNDEMVMGPHMGGQWGKAAVLSTEYQTFTGTFMPTNDIEDAVWSFNYANGTMYGGNAKDGDEIWFDEISVVCTSCDDCVYSEDTSAADDDEEPAITDEGVQILGETSFEEKIFPWSMVTSFPASQSYDIDEGALHINIESADGADKEKWDLGLHHENLDFKAGHVYEVSFKAKANREGMELSSHIGNTLGDIEYFVLLDDEMVMGPHMDGQWGRPAVLSTEYQTFTGKFMPTEDIEDAEWIFQYANGTYYEGNAVDGDELWLDDVSIVCTTCEADDPVCGYVEADEPTIDDTDDEPAAPPVLTGEGVQILGETSFEETVSPWKLEYSLPAKQSYAVEDGALHITIDEADGADGEKWDLSLHHRKLSFKAGHVYEVSFTAKANRDGMELDSHIGSLRGDEEYFVILDDEMVMGPHMGGQWGKPAVLSTEYQTFTGIFMPTKDIENVEWTFHYANGTNYYGNAVDGDEIWFDEISIVCTTCTDDDRCEGCGYDEMLPEYGMINDFTYIYEDEEETVIPPVAVADEKHKPGKDSQASEPAYVSVPDSIILGDVNEDGKVDMNDLTSLSLYLLGENNLNEKALKSADVNRDGSVKITDLASIRQYVSKVISSFI